MRTQITVDSRIYNEISDYCKENAMDVNRFVDSLLRRGFATEKYGPTPCGLKPANSANKIIAEETKEEEKPRQETAPVKKPQTRKKPLKVVNEQTVLAGSADFYLPFRNIAKRFQVGGDLLQ